MRSYIIEDLNCDESDPVEMMKFQIREQMVKQLAAKWNQLNRQMEMRSWREEDEYLDEEEFFEEQLEETYACALAVALENGKSPEEAKAIALEEREKHQQEIEAEMEKPRLEMEVIEEHLEALGARMMRPYEHWNEHERYMEYMENRYDYDSGW